VSADLLDVFQSTQLIIIVYSHCFLSCFEYLLNFLIIIPVLRDRPVRVNSLQEIALCTINQQAQRYRKALVILCSIYVIGTQRYFLACCFIKATTGSSRMVKLGYPTM